MTIKKASRLGGSPLGDMDLLSSTVEQPGNDTKKDTKAVPKAKKTSVKAPKTAKSPDSSKSIEPSSSDQYGYGRQVKWPLLPEAKPYLMEVPQSGDKILSTAFTMRLPLDLDVTVDAHCKKLQANKSEWVRKAMLAQLAAEQQEISKAK